MRKLILLIAVGVLALPAIQPAQVDAAPVVEDVINVNVSGVPLRFRRLFQRAETFWDDRVQGFSRTLPQIFAETLEPLNITATMGVIDGVGGTLGAAGPRDIAFFSTGGSGPFDDPFRQWAVSQTADMRFDTDDFESDEFDMDTLQAIVIHEMGHTLGLGSLWQQNGLIGADGNYSHDGFALREYRRESGFFSAQSVPVEQDGGAGTAGGHWDDDDLFFNQTNEAVPQTEYMLGSINTFTESGEFVITPKFLSNTSLGSLEDMGWSTLVGPGYYNDQIGSTITWGVDIPPFVFRPAVPEPGSIVVLLGVGIAALSRRKR